MQPIEAKFSGGVANKVIRDLPDAEAAELPPTLQNALQQMLDQPDAHTIGDLAALTERLTNEMMLFSPLVGEIPSKTAAQPTSDLGTCADPAQIELQAEFLRELEA
jgi:hypothetical protein